jgi:hypothetical protein
MAPKLSLIYDIQQDSGNKDNLHVMTVFCLQIPIILIIPASDRVFRGSM